MASVSVRWADLVCGTCQSSFRDLGWTVPMYGAGFGEHVTCESCRSQIRHLTRERPVTVRRLPTLTPAQRRHEVAVHEAAHAVIGVTTMHPLDFVEIHASEVVVADGTSEEFIQRGETRWILPYTVELQDNLAMCWAGQQAGLRWLVECGLDTPENRLDVIQAGWHDSALARDEAAAHGHGPQMGRTRANLLLDQNWPEVLAVADALARCSRLSGPDVEHLIASTAPRPHAHRV